MKLLTTPSIKRMGDIIGHREAKMSIKRHGIPKSGGLPFAKAAGADGWLFVSGKGHCPSDDDE